MLGFFLPTISLVISHLYLPRLTSFDLEVRENGTEAACFDYLEVSQSKAYILHITAKVNHFNTYLVMSSSHRGIPSKRPARKKVGRQSV
jgi:hypothetical protein